MAADEVHGNAVEPTDLLARGVDVGEPRPVGVDGPDELVAPGARVQVDEPGGARARALRQHDPAQVVEQQLGEHQDVAGAVELAAVVGRQLVDGVAGHELGAGEVVEVAGPDAVGHGAPAVEPFVAVAVRGSDEVAVVVEQAVVEAPRVDPDRRERADLVGEGEPSSGLGDEALPVPSQRAVGVADRPVPVPVHDLRLEGPRGEVDDGDPDGRGPEVDGGDEGARGPRRGRHSPDAAWPEPRSVATVGR